VRPGNAQCSTLQSQCGGPARVRQSIGSGPSR
jgi:hypothetical protein